MSLAVILNIKTFGGRANCVLGRISRFGPPTRFAGGTQIRKEIEMDFDERYRAMEQRDESHAGEFFAAVTSTGIYCRPGCPARMPKRENVRFYLTPAAARTDGFRACLRCHPDDYV